MDSKINVNAPFGIEIVPEDEYIEVIASGRSDFYSFIAMIDSIVNDLDYKPYYRIFIDLTEMDYNPTYDEVLGVFSKLKELKNILKNRISILTSRTIAYDLLDLLSALSVLTGMKIEVFRDRDIAEAWLFSDY